MPRGVVAAAAAKGLSVLLFLVPLSAMPVRAIAQQPSPQFEDLAARAAAARDKGNLPQAIELYGQAAQLKPDWAEGWFYLGLLQYSSDNFPQAIEAFNHLLQIQPNAPPAMALRGLCEFETGAYDAALSDLDQAVQKGAANEPRNEQIIRFHYAQLLARAGRFQGALLQYGFFASKHIDDPDLLLGLGLAGMRNSTLPKEIPAGDRELFTAAGNAGYVFLSGDTQLADTLFNKLFAQYPTAPGLHFFYGSLLSMHGPDLSIPQFQSEVAIAPSNVSARAILAYSLMFEGRFREARAEAETAFAAAPDMEIAQIALGRSLAETGEPQRAAELLNQVLKNDPNNMEAHIGMAVVYARTGKREDAYRERMVCLGLEK
ncbi:MAG: tetratricopeptide repeat protein [Terracidiphilus sp.]